MNVATRDDPLDMLRGQRGAPMDYQRRSARRLLMRCGRDCYEIYLLPLHVLGLLRGWLPPAQCEGDVSP